MNEPNSCLSGEAVPGASPPANTATWVPVALTASAVAPTRLEKRWGSGVAPQNGPLGSSQTSTASDCG